MRNKFKALTGLNGVGGRSDASGYRVQTDGTLEMFIFEEIDDFFGIGAIDVARVLRENKDVGKILVHLNSPGGMVTESTAIYNQFRLHGAEIIMQVEGLAASGASVIAMAGDQIIIFEGAMFMIHGAWSVTRGFASDHLATADVLSKMGDTIADIYVARTGQKRDEVLEKMLAETWFTAKESVEFGLADTFIEGKAMAASAVHMSRFQNPPEALRATAIDLDNPVGLDVGRLALASRVPTWTDGMEPASAEAVQAIFDDPANWPPNHFIRQPMMVVPIPPIPATPTPAPAQETDEMKTIAKALGLPEDATEAQIVAVLAPQRHTISELHRLTDEDGDESALGVIQGWQASHGQLDELKAERKAEKLEAETKEHGELITKGQESKQITAATLEYWKAQPLAALKGFVKVASPVVAVGEVAPPAPGESVDAASDAPLYKGKTYAKMSGPERVALHNEDPDLFKEMSAEYRDSLSDNMPDDSAEG